MTNLTPIEEKIMLKLWSLEEATVQQLLDLYEDPKPAFNTVSTQIRILEKKKVVGHRKKGRGYIYFPKIDQLSYQNYLIEHVKNSYFNGSTNELISHLSATRSINDFL
ncbi:MAG: BlaI/MecI/CopY family transcriptional regulator [Crocinitomicaceae bacterium]|nr:BlaI/MecI/CopY family transcriptional regulator [Crocinitomicaceae bacterium]